MRGVAECVAVADVMVAGAHEHDSVLGQAQRCQRDRCGRVAPLRLHDDPRVCGIGQLLLDMAEMRLARHHHRRGKTVFAGATQQGGGEQRGIANQWQERLGLLLARPGPEASATSPAKNNRNDLGHFQPSSKVCLAESGSTRGHLASTPATPKPIGWRNPQRCRKCHKAQAVALPPAKLRTYIPHWAHSRSGRHPRP